MLRKIISAVLILMVILPLSYAATDDDIPSENLDTSSKFRLFLKNSGLTLLGQQQGCSSQPDKVQHVTGQGSRISFSYAANNAPGLANIYSINPDGSWTYLEEKNYDYMASGYYFGKFQYAVEFYDCSTEKDYTPYVTPDGYKNGDLVCKQGEYLAKIVFKDERSYSYERVATCQNGCQFSTCNSPTQDNEALDEFREEEGGGLPTGGVKYWDSGEASEEYSEVIKQLENKIVDLEKLSETLKSQNAGEEEIAEVEGQKSALEKEKEDLEDQKPTDLTYIIIGIAAIGGGAAFARWRGWL